MIDKNHGKVMYHWAKEIFPITRSISSPGNKKTLDLKGWRIVDQYNNNVNFSLNIVAKNDIFKTKEIDTISPFIIRSKFTKFNLFITIHLENIFWIKL